MKMKKIILAIFMALISGSLINNANAQTNKGNVMVGGNLANLNLGLESGSTTTFTLTPKAAWFVQDNIALGGYGSLGIAHNEGTDITYGIGPLGRYYISDKNAVLLKKSQFFFEANAGIEGTNYASGSSTNGVGFGFGPGWTYFITPGIGLELLLKYDGRVGFGSETFTNNLSFNVGFQIYLPTKKVREVIKEVR